ncbi:MAG TPA: hypothetical protein VMV93_08615, partial [Chloroflexota bacterium]|nr:hypothetical protein [Chloroflexota bacterium]
DPSALQNIPLRPIFGPPLAAFFLLGAALVLVRARKWLAYRWLLLWFLFMSVPGAVTIDTPNTLRVLSLAPAVFMVASVGLYTVAVQIRPPFLRTGTLLLVLIFTTVHDFRSYFGTWAQDPATYYASSTPSLKAAPFLQAHASQTMFIADEASAPIRLLAPATRAAGWLPVEAAAIPIPSDLTTRGVLYAGTDNSILVRLAPLWLPGIQVLPHTVGPDGRPDLLAFLWPAPAVAHFRSNQKRVVYGGARDYQVASYQLAQAAGNVDLRVLWRPLSPSGPYDLYVHLINSAARQVAQADYLVWPVVHLQGAEQLLEGTPSTDELLTESTFKLPAGDYAALLGVARRSRRDRAKIVGGRLGPELRIPITV